MPGDPQRTAARILAAPHLFHLGFAGYLVAFLLDVPVAVLFYVLLRSTGKSLAVAAAAVRIVYAAFALANLRNYLGARLDAYDRGFKLALLLFGVHLVLLGVLLFRSRLVPAAIGSLIVIAGCAYLADTVTLLASPSLHAALAPYLAVPASFEILLAGWLLVTGGRHAAIAP